LSGIAGAPEDQALLRSAMQPPQPPPASRFTRSHSSDK
jgi:hypothetical protein